jgi:hypothetical protein
VEAPNVMTSIRQIVTMIEQQGIMPDVEVVRGICRRLKACENPEKIVGSRGNIVGNVKNVAEAWFEAQGMREADGERTVAPFIASKL